MNLDEYPRPANDTGIGAHWAPGFAAAVGMGQIREFWIPEMKSMGVKWLKIFNHDGALDLCELLLAEEIMPIVRLYRPSPNPGRLGVKELVHLDALIRVGVRYFEFNNEPDNDAEWKGGRVPVNGLDLTVESTIASMELILERGGMPAVPALSNGSRWDLAGKIVAAGRRDLFDGPVWQAVHNFSRNRPLDYPYDIGNQEGAAFTERFYRALAIEEWGEDAWRGRSLADVNRLRYDRRSPGATIMDDHACWLAYEYCDALNQKQIGRSIPILSTECGYLVGEDIDPRYPATTPDMHMAQTLEACRIMMGTSQRFNHAPDYHFCTAFWLLANERLGSMSTWWEGHAWYSDRWPGGHLPIVRALKAEPKASRLPELPPSRPLIALRGVVAHAGDRRTVLLEQGDVTIARTTLDVGERFEFPDLIPGAYRVRIEGASLVQPVELTPDQGDVLINLDLGVPVATESRSMLDGKVRGGAGAVVMLVRKSDGEEWVTMARDDGTYRFVDLPAGNFSVRIYPSGSSVDDIVLDGHNHATADLASAGWGYTVTTAEDVQQIGAAVVSVPGHRGLEVQIHGAEWASEPVKTGTAPQFGDAACRIAPLEEGHYIVTVAGVSDEDGRPTEIEARFQVDKRSVPRIEFVYTDLLASEAAAESVITGKVIGMRPGQPLSVVLTDEEAQRIEQSVDADGSFTFAALGAGLYTVMLAGHEEAAAVSDIALDGKNVVSIELALPAPPPQLVEDTSTVGSVIRGVAVEAGGQFVRLVDAVGNERKQTLDSEGRFKFAGLPAGLYAVFIAGGYSQSRLEVDGNSGWEIQFAPVDSVWESSVTRGGFHARLQCRACGGRRQSQPTGAYLARRRRGSDGADRQFTGPG